MATNNLINTPLSGTTGTGQHVGDTSPTLITPALGTPSSGNLVNCTGYLGDWVKITSTTASSSATIDFTGLSSTYAAYKVVIDRAASATDNVAFWMRTSTNNGSSYDAGASDYAHVRFVALANTSTSVQAAGDDADAQIIINNGCGNNTEEAYSGEITIFNPSDAHHCRITFMGFTRINDATHYFTNGGGVRLAVADVDAIRFLMASGNIASGKFTLYGLRA